MQFNDLHDQFKRYALFERGMTTGTYKSIVRTLDLFQEQTEIQNIKEVKEENIRDFLIDMTKKFDWKAKTFRTYLQNFRSYYNWCIKNSYVKINPAEKIEKPALPRRIPRCLTREQFINIITHVNLKEWRYEFEKIRNETILYTFALTGLRLNELINLQVSDVDLNAKEIIVKEGKGKKDRMIPIHPRLLKILENYLREKRKSSIPTKWFFTGVKSDKRLRAKDIQEICRKISKESGLKFTPHMLRHTFGRLSLDAGMNLYDIKEILGHSDVSTTQIYLSVATDKIKKRFQSTQII